MCGDGGDHLPGFVLCRARMLARNHPNDFRGGTTPCGILAFVKAWHAALAALSLFSPQASTAADDLRSAARELARKTSAWSRGPVAAVYRNLSSLPDSEITTVRREFEAALAGSAEAATGAEVRITLSENASEFLLVEEIRKGDEAQVWMASWKRSQRTLASVSGITLDKKLVWEQDEPILDVAFAGDRMLVLAPSQITVHNGRAERAVLKWGPFAPGRPWPRDLRGRLRVNGDRVQAFLPWLVCNGSATPALVLQCAPSEAPWVLESGDHAILLANFAADRNYFDGRVVAQNGSSRSVAPFYSAVAVDEPGGTTWLLALVDGRAELFDAAWVPVATLASWGSDLVGISAQCAAASLVLATRPGDANEPDALQAFSIVNRAAAPVSSPLTFSGPVTALWPSGATAAVAVARDLATGKYGAYVVTVVCSP